VDVIQNQELENSVFALIQKLKKLYFNRKVNPNKKGKVTRSVKKRYIVGIKEVLKHLEAENLKMVIVAVNLERVDGENGLDEMTYRIIQRSRELGIPLVFALSRYRLGFVTKFQG
jgi:selenocysteine insertion sequence-binding protein 2